MVEWYFYLEKGKAKGPLKKDEVLNAFKQGSLGPLDLVYKKGQSSWLPAFEHKDFQFLFEDQKLEAFTSISHRKWVLLQKKRPEEGRGFRQIGPFTEAEVKRKIHTGEFSYQDYAWASGLEKWTKLEKLQEFNGKAIKLELPKLHPEEEIDTEGLTAEVKDVSDIEVYRRPQQERPEEAGTKDLTRPWDPEVEINIHMPEEPKAKHRKAANASVSTLTRPGPPPPPADLDAGVWPWIMRLAIFGISLTLVALVLILSSSPRGLKLKEWMTSVKQRVLSEPPKEQSPVAEPVTKQPVAVTPPPQAPPPKVVPVEPKNLSSRLVNGNILEFQTDGSYHFPIRVRLFGQVGKVYSKTGIYKDVWVQWGPGENPKLSLRSLKLPKGDFVLWLSQKGVEKIQGLRIDDMGGSHFERLAEAKKWQAVDFNSERRDLVLLSADYAALSQELERSASKWASNRRKWQSFYSQWLKKKINAERSRGIRRLGRLSSRQLPWSWHQLQSGVERLTEKGQLYNKAIRKGEFLKLTPSREDLTKVFKELRGDVLRTKLF